MQYLRTILKFNVKRRNPFSKPKIPIYLQLYRLANLPWKRYLRILIGLPLGQVWKPIFRLGRASRGSFVYDNRTVFFRAGNTQFASVYFDMFRDGFEAEVATVIDLLTNDNSVFFDIGANWGHHSLYLASKPGFKGKIVAFEPVPDTFEDLVSVVDQTALHSVIQCKQIALSDKSGTLNMSFPDAISSGMARLDPNGKGPLVQMDALDHLKLGVDPDVIKLDAEGEEANILRGASQLIRRCKPMIIFESFREVDNASAALERFRLLADLGYTFFQTVFVRNENGNEYAIQIVWEDALSSSPNQTFGLYEFDWEERFLFGGSNFLACHKDRIPELMNLASKPCARNRAAAS
ncbi:MAG TPA: FkbM family methyltransferase [Chlamydiales bacterium]|nr:FkbM family methyltransferase [Chlamydiales bacterium]